jgi:hypothetical protein
MGLYNFQYQFEPFILNWSKRHTIRSERVHSDLPGNVMHLYVGLRRPGARCLMRAQCVRTEYIVIEGGPNRQHRISTGLSLGYGDSERDERTGAPVYGSRFGGPLRRLAGDELQALAWRDGFRPAGSTLTNPGDAFQLMMSFWTGRLPFEGAINHWNPARQAVPDPLTKILRWVDVEPPASAVVHRQEVAHAL